MAESVAGERRRRASPESVAGERRRRASPESVAGEREFFASACAGEERKNSRGNELSISRVFAAANTLLLSP